MVEPILGKDGPNLLSQRVERRPTAKANEDPLRRGHSILHQIFRWLVDDGHRRKENRHLVEHHAHHPSELSTDVLVAVFQNLVLNAPQLNAMLLGIWEDSCGRSRSILALLLVLLLEGLKAEVSDRFELVELRISVELGGRRRRCRLTLGRWEHRHTCYR